VSRRRPPDPLPRFYRWRTNILQAPLFFAYTGLCGSCSLLASLWDKTGRLQHRIAQTWASGCVRISGARLTVRGVENLCKHPVAVYAANHTSYMDTPVIFSTLPFQFRILAKKELWTMPFIGWHLNRSGQIPVDTVSPNATVSSLGAGVRALRAGMPLFVFPEGSRTPDGTMQPFLAGAAFLEPCRLRRPAIAHRIRHGVAHQFVVGAHTTRPFGQRSLSASNVTRLMFSTSF